MKNGEMSWITIQRTWKYIDVPRSEQTTDPKIFTAFIYNSLSFHLIWHDNI